MFLAQAGVVLEAAPTTVTTSSSLFLVADDTVDVVIAIAGAVPGSVVAGASDGAVGTDGLSCTELTLMGNVSVDEATDEATE